MQPALPVLTKRTSRKEANQFDERKVCVFVGGGGSDAVVAVRTLLASKQ